MFPLFRQGHKLANFHRQDGRLEELGWIIPAIFDTRPQSLRLRQQSLRRARAGNGQVVLGAVGNVHPKSSRDLVVRQVEWRGVKKGCQLAFRSRGKMFRSTPRWGRVRQVGLAGVGPTLKIPAQGGSRTKFQRSGRGRGGHNFGDDVEILHCGWVLLDAILLRGWSG